MDTDPGGTDLSERQCYYAVSPPGEAAWVADQHRRLAVSSSSAGPSGTQHNAMKRARDSGDTAADVDMETSRRSITPVQRSSRNKGPLTKSRLTCHGGGNKLFLGGVNIMCWICTMQQYCSTF